MSGSGFPAAGPGAITGSGSADTGRRARIRMPCGWSGIGAGGTMATCGLKVIGGDLSASDTKYVHSGTACGHPHCAMRMAILFAREMAWNLNGSHEHVRG